MNKFCVLTFILLLSTGNGFIHRYNPYPYYPPSKRQIFGDMTSDRIGYQHETRIGIPFFTREALIAFPSDYTTDSPYDHNYLIRGIIHENANDDLDCVPQLDIIEGGIYDRNVTLKITSQSGCSIDSKVSIYGEKEWKN